MAGAVTNPLMLMKLMSASVAVANRAGCIIREIMKAGDLGVVHKNLNENDPQTEADRKAQRCIVSSLRRRFDGITVIGEEEESDKEVPEDMIEMGDFDEALAMTCPTEYENVNPQEVVVWVDPVDGTKEYTQGFLDHVTVLIGISVKGKAVAGVIHQPYYNYKAGPNAKMGRTIWGGLGMGTFGVDFKENPKRVITTTRSHGTKEVQDTIDAMKPDEVLRVGGAGHKVLLLLEGRATAYVFASPGCKKWDTCAPEALLHAVGGRLTDVHGNLYTYDKDVKHMNTGGVIAAYRQHEFYLSQVPQAIRDVLPS